MKNEEKLEKVRLLMDDLDIIDEDTRQEIYLKALSQTEDQTDNELLVNVINPILYKNFNELTAYKKRFVPARSLDKMIRKQMISNPFFSNREDINRLNNINEVATSFSLLHPYILEEVFMKGTSSHDLGKEFNIDTDMVDALIEQIVSDIRKILI